MVEFEIDVEMFQNSNTFYSYLVSLLLPLNDLNVSE